MDWQRWNPLVHSTSMAFLRMAEVRVVDIQPALKKKKATE
jgi:hypothetical protein